MPFLKQYDEALVAQIQTWAEQGWSSGMIAKQTNKTRSAIASLCKRQHIKLKGRCTLQSPGGVKRGRRALPAGPDEIYAPCLWPEGQCQELRQSLKKPYCREHNQRAYKLTPKMI